MTLRHLQVFEMVCAKLSVTAAAEALNMTQPAVSIAIRELESFYRTRLFDRIGRRIYLTEQGRRLREDARAILSRFDESVRVLRDEAGFAVCRIGANVTVGECFLPALLGALQKRMPELQTSVFIGNSREIERRLQDNAIDFALLDTLDDAPNRTVLELFSEEMDVVCAPEFDCPGRMTVQALAAQPLLLREKGSGSRSCIDAVLQTHDCAAHPKVEGATNFGLLKLAESGAGIAVLPAALAAPAVKEGCLKRLEILDGAFLRRYYLAFLTKKYISPALHRAMAEIRAFYAGR